MISAFYENPFLEAEAPQLVSRFDSDLEPLNEALNDLCRCGVLLARDGRFLFKPEDGIYHEVASLAAAHRGEEGVIRQQVLELETLARIRERLAVTRQEVSAILELVPVGVILLDRYGQLLKVNTLASDMLGIGTEEREAGICKKLGLCLDEILEHDVCTEVELERPLGVVSGPFHVAGSDGGAVITLQDITHRREMEAKTERMREEFFSMIRHELKKPLMTVERFLDHSCEEEAEGLCLARTAASHLSAMVDDMLLLARLEHDPMSVRPKDRVSLQFLIAGADLAFRDRALEKGLRFLTLSPEQDISFMGDERRLTQVLGNLVDNAIKFTPRGGEVVVRGDGDSERVWVCVTDTGPGIPESERERVLGKFYQVRKDEGRPSGLGLGLAICRHVAFAHGGEVEVGDGKVNGTSVLLRLPMRIAD